MENTFLGIFSIIHIPGYYNNYILIEDGDEKSGNHLPEPFPPFS